jgi:hypothetical protein
MRASSIVHLLLLAGLTAGCGVPTERGSPSAAPSASAAGTAFGSGVERVQLPAGFPVLPGAVPADLPGDDPGLIARWTTDQPGSATYDFYVTALPSAGYPILGLYPGGEWAIIRFALPDGAIWQVLAHDTGDGQASIEVRRDRP